MRLSLPLAYTTDRHTMTQQQQQAADLFKAYARDHVAKGQA